MLRFRRRVIQIDEGQILSSYSDLLLLKVLPSKGVIRFRKRGELGLRYIGTSQGIARVGKVIYRLDLPEELSQIHNTFHVSQLRKCITNESTSVPFEDIHVDKLLNYVENPVVILDKKTKSLCKKVICLVKVQWQHRKRIIMDLGTRRRVENQLPIPI